MILSHSQRANEEFYDILTTPLKNGIVGTCALALREAMRPDMKQTKSVLMDTVLRLGDVEVRPEEALEVSIKTSKCTALSRPKGWKKFVRRDSEEEEVGECNGAQRDKIAFAQLSMRTEYYIDRSVDQDVAEGGVDGDGDQSMKDAEESTKEEMLEKVEKEQLVRGFKYGSTYAPCPDGDFPRLKTTKGIDICGFFQAKNVRVFFLSLAPFIVSDVKQFRRELSLGEIQYVWADPSQPQQQVALSSIVQAMYEKNVMAIARWVTKDGMDPKMGVLAPSVFENVDCLLWAQVRFLRSRVYSCVN
jgi:ATP-dependent DNA helicase 2 subunit 2